MSGSGADVADLTIWTRALQQRLRQGRQRRLLLLAGGQDWGLATGVILRDILAPVAWLEVGAGPGWVNTRQVRRYLGQEFDGVLLDGHVGCDPEALAALAGTVVAGGVLLLLMPPLAEWGSFADPERQRIAVHPHDPAAVGGRFLARLARIIADHPGALVLTPDHPLPPLPIISTPPPAPAVDDSDCRTADQAEAVAAVRRVAEGHRRRPLVLTADRGRGKSTALGIAAARLFQGTPRTVVVTAPHREAVTSLFAAVERHATGQTPADISFWPPDRLLRETPPVDLLLVDEAAGIPGPLLEAMVARYRRVVFATTVHGYEGSGRGFALRFRDTLARHTNQWRELSLTTPIRWAVDDPLEALIFRLLLLDAEPATLTDIAAMRPESCDYQRLDRDQLAVDDQGLTALFGLLVQAHYRTRPLDLRHLLDGANVSVHCLSDGGQPLAVALLAQEGGLDDELATAVWLGQRRVRGQLLPQTLVAHAGCREAAGMQGERIMRIAVHPALQGRGFGSYLLDRLLVATQQSGGDWLGSSFGVTVPLLGFWQRRGLLPVWLGHGSDAASGVPSAVVLSGLSALGQQWVATLTRRWSRQLLAMLSDQQAALPGAVVMGLLAATPPPPPDPEDWLDGISVAHGRRGVERALAAVTALVAWGVAVDGGGLPSPAREVMIQRVLQRQAWPTVVAALGLTGRRQAESLLRAGLLGLIQRQGDSTIQQALAALPTVDKGDRA